MTQRSAHNQTARLAASIAAAGFLFAATAAAQTPLPPPAYGGADARQDRIEELERQLRVATAENEQLQHQLNQANREVTRMRAMVGSEAIETDELGAAHHGPVEDVARLSLGAIRDWRINDRAVFGIGALVQQHFTSDVLEPLYDGDPMGAMGFVRLKIG